MLAQKGSADKRKGISISNQQVLYGKNLELRILLQKCLQASNNLPRPSTYTTLVKKDSKTKAGYGGLRDAAAGALENLLELQSVLLRRNPVLSEALDAQENLVPKKDSSKLKADGLWSRVSAQHEVFARYRDESIDRWHARTVLSSGSALLKTSLRVLNQSVSSQVSTLMRDPEKIVKRSRILVSERPKILCERAEADGRGAKRRRVSEAEDEEADEEEGGAGKAGLRDYETFDDEEFYKQLLKEFLDKSLTGSQANRLQPVKRRKLVDRRASKGRKVRYHVHEKLVGFTCAVESAVPQFAQQLLSNLFNSGKK